MAALSERDARTPYAALGAILLAALMVRLMFLAIFDDPIVSDSKAYYVMAQGLAERGVLRDVFGQVAFYSPGYPLVLAPVFMLFGADPEVARAVNVVLSLAAVLLTYRLGIEVTANRLAALLAAAAMALFMPHALDVEHLLKENLSVTLMLGFALAVVRHLRSERPALTALAAGLLYGALLLTGGSAILVASGFLLAVLMRRTGWLASLAVFAAGALIVLGPWWAFTARTLGAPVLATNASFNLYLGNNPAADGRFISIADTPLGPEWQALRAKHGELGVSRLLEAEAKGWMQANPERVAELTAFKLAYFFQPNYPNAGDTDHGLVVMAGRWAAAAQEAIILALALVALVFWRRWSPGMRLILLIALSFWVVHGLAVIILRYRDPIMPLFMILGAYAVAELVGRRRKPADADRRLTERAA